MIKNIFTVTQFIPAITELIHYLNANNIDYCIQKEKSSCLFFFDGYRILFHKYGDRTEIVFFNAGSAKMLYDFIITI